MYLENESNIEITKKDLHRVVKILMLCENHEEQILAIYKTDCCHMDQDNLEIGLFSWSYLVLLRNHCLVMVNNVWMQRIHAILQNHLI